MESHYNDLHHDWNRGLHRGRNMIFLDFRSVVAFVLIVENCLTVKRFSTINSIIYSIRLYCNFSKRIIPILIVLQNRNWELHKNIMQGSLCFITNDTTDHMLTSSCISLSIYLHIYQYRKFCNQLGIVSHIVLNGRTTEGTQNLRSYPKDLWLSHLTTRVWLRNSKSCLYRLRSSNRTTGFKIIVQSSK